MSSAGFKAFRRIQIGAETTSGTAVAANKYLVGTLGMQLNQDIHMPDQWETGRLASFEQSDVLMRDAALPFDSDASYGDVPYLLEMSVEQGTATAPVADTSPAILTYEPNYTSANNPRTFTVEYGDNVQAYESSYVACRQLEFSGQAGGVLSVKADLFGQDMTESTFTSSINPAIREIVKMSDADVYVNSAWADTPTAVNNVLVDMNWRFMTGYAPQRYVDGTFTFTEISQAKRHVELDMTVAFNNTTRDWFDDVYRPQVYRVFRIRFDNGGSTTAQRYLHLEMGGYITQFATLTEREGQNIAKIKAVSAYNITATRDMRVAVAHGAAALSF